MSIFTLLPLADVISPMPLLLGAVVFIVIVVAVLVGASSLILFLVLRHRKRSQSRGDKTDVNQ